MQSQSMFRRVTRFYAVMKNPRLHQFFLDRKHELENPYPRFDVFISTIRQFVFLRNVTEFNRLDIKSQAALLNNFFARGVESINENITEDEISAVMALYSFALEYKDAGIDSTFLEDANNIYEKNFNRSLDKFIGFANTIDGIVPLLEPQHQKTFRFMKDDFHNILRSEQHTLSTLQKLKIAAILVNFDLSDEEMTLLSECIKPIATVR